MPPKLVKENYFVSIHILDLSVIRLWKSDAKHILSDKNHIENTIICVLCKF